MAWYAIFVKTGNEEKVKLRLEYRFRGEPEVFIPRRILRERRDGIWREKNKVLFASYVLIRGEITSNVLMQLWDVPDLLKLLKLDCKPVSIPEEEIDVFRHLMDGADTIGLSKACMVGDRVEFIQGPLADSSIRGQIVSIDKRKGRAVVQVVFLGEVRLLTLGFELLAKETVDAESITQGSSS